ncbi:MAG: glycerophosphoryl diester phosphodiesterase [Candidatus Saccharibacteria bacterium]|nr:glycerophosphoryl diester phosphodiesterase [Candidatus Saccharibacteria bacterium]
MKIIGHRGAKGLAPENTIASIRKALEHDVDGIEFDVRLTRDQVPILLHDDHLVDPAGNKLSVPNTDLDELKAHKPDLATLEEALSAIGGRVSVIVEVKPQVPAQPIIAILKELPQDYRVSVASFDYSLLRTIHATLPDLPLVVNDMWSGTRATRRARKLGTKRLGMYQMWLWKPFLVPMAKRGWLISPFTVNDVAKAKRWERYGIYGIYTDYPDRFQK